MKNEEKFNEVYYFAFYFCNKTLAKSNLEKEEFVLQIIVYHPGEVTVGTQGRN